MTDPAISAGVARSRGGRSGTRFWPFEIPEVWVRFLLANVGLVLAFAAALFSTVARESGNLWATLILAGVALLLATIVGLTTVPYLARRVAGGRVRDAFDYDVTRVGVIYVATVVLIGIAALNTGNNLLYVIVAAMLAAILVSGVASAGVLRGLEVNVAVPEQAFAGTPVAGRITVRNRRRWLPSFSIRVNPLAKGPSSKRWQWVPTTFGFPPGQPSAGQWIKLPDRQLRRVAGSSVQPGIFTDAAYFPYIPAGRELTAEMELCFPRRGRYEQNGVGLATRFPFAFLTKTRGVPLEREILVYPKVEQAEEFLAVLPLITGELETFARGRGADLYRIREYLPDDSARHVDWKATAKSGSLKVREFSREDERKLRLVFDNPAPGVVSETAYENAVTLAASLAWHFAADGKVSFLGQGYSGSESLNDFLSYLAMVAPQSADSLLDRLETSDEYNLILTSRPHGTVPASLWATSLVIFIGDGR
jgi:uncharacterized protein (DUF58 family)